MTASLLGLVARCCPDCCEHCYTTAIETQAIMAGDYQRGRDYEREQCAKLVESQSVWQRRDLIHAIRGGQ